MPNTHLSGMSSRMRMHGHNRLAGSTAYQTHEGSLEGESKAEAASPLFPEKFKSFAYLHKKVDRLPYLGLYGATKFALEGLTESYRYELGPFGIDAAIIQPGTYPTCISANRQDPADAAGFPCCDASKEPSMGGGSRGSAGFSRTVPWFGTIRS